MAPASDGPSRQVRRAAAVVAFTLVALVAVSQVPAIAGAFFINRAAVHISQVVPPMGANPVELCMKGAEFTPLSTGGIEVLLDSAASWQRASPQVARLRGLMWLYGGDYSRAGGALSLGRPQGLQGYWRGCAEIGAGRHDAALAAWQRIVPVDQPYIVVGTELLHREQYSAAAAFLEAALQLNPQNVSSLVRLSNCYVGLQNWTKALEYIGRAAALSPNDWVVQVSLGGIRHAAGDYDGAAEAYRTAIELEPQRGFGPYRGLSNVLVTAAGDEFAAVDTLVDALRLWPEDAETYLAVADIYARLGRGEAQTYWSGQASSRSRDPMPADFLQAMNSYYAARKDEARQMLERILERYPDHSGASAWFVESIQKGEEE